eukprot:Nk52_evm38s294 gene=Nk52_evmTU38s294
MGGGGSKVKDKKNSKKKTPSQKELELLEVTKAKQLEDKIYSILASLPFLSDYSTSNNTTADELLRGLARDVSVSDPVSMSHGEVILRKGMENRAGVYILLEGFVEVTSKTGEFVYARLGVDSVFGELSTLFDYHNGENSADNKNKSSASVSCYGNCTMLLVQREKILHVLDSMAASTGGGQSDTTDDAVKRRKLKWMTEKRYFDTEKEFDHGNTIKSILVCESLQAVPLFKAMPLNVIQELFKHGTTQLYKPNAMIASRNTSAHSSTSSNSCLYVVLRGNVGFVDDTGTETFAQTSWNSEENWIGEQSLFITDPPSSSDAPSGCGFNLKALTPCYIFALTRENIVQTFHRTEREQQRRNKKGDNSNNNDPFSNSWDIFKQHVNDNQQKLKLELGDSYLQKLRNLSQGEMDRHVIFKLLRKVDVFSTADLSYIWDLTDPFGTSLSAKDRYILYEEANAEISVGSGTGAGTTFLVLKGIVLEVDVDGNAVRSLLRGGYYNEHTDSNYQEQNSNDNINNNNSNSTSKHKVIVGEAPCILLAISPDPS